MDTTRPRGRPRTAEAIALDNAVLAALETAPMTRARLCATTGAPPSKIYLSVSRLRRAGAVVLDASGPNPHRLWTRAPQG